MKKILLIAIYSSLFTFFLFGCTQKKPAITEEATQTTSAAAEMMEKTFALEELAKYDGKDGRPAYAAVDGIVYDLSSVFSKGKHYSHVAGKSLTEEFYSQHTKEDLKNYPVVGKLVE